MRAGEYPSESELIHDGLRPPFARDAAVDAWLRDEVATAYDALTSDQFRRVTARELRECPSTRCAAGELPTPFPS